MTLGQSEIANVIMVSTFTGINLDSYLALVAVVPKRKML